MNKPPVTLTEIDDNVFLLSYHDHVCERHEMYLDWYSAEANCERRAQEQAQVEKEASIVHV